MDIFPEMRKHISSVLSSPYQHGATPACVDIHGPGGTGKTQQATKISDDILIVQRFPGAIVDITCPRKLDENSFLEIHA